MKGYSEGMSRLIASLGRLPGIGRRTAERIVFHLLKSPRQEAEELSRSILQVRDSTRFCELCHNFADQNLCSICRDPGRDRGIICVVEDPKDVIAIEKAGNFAGIYHVLLGYLSALEGIGPSELRIHDLLERVRKGEVREVILATNPNTEGETTALYLARALKDEKVRVTRLAHGISVGSMLEYTDQATLARALEGRIHIT